MKGTSHYIGIIVPTNKTHLFNARLNSAQIPDDARSRMTTYAERNLEFWYKEKFTVSNILVRAHMFFLMIASSSFTTYSSEEENSNTDYCLSNLIPFL